MNEENGLELKGVMSEGYGIIPKKVMNDTGLSVEAKSIYAFIASYSGNGNTAFPTVDYITHKLNISRQRFNKHRKQLEDKGYITVKQERQEGSQFNHNIYTIEYIPMPWLSFPTSENPTSQNPTSQNVTTNNNSINNNSINKDSQQSQKRYADDSQYMKVAVYLFEKIKERLPNKKEPDFQKWADEVRKTVELDGVPVERYKEVLDWSQNDDFWQANILSTNKLRKQFDTIYLQMQRDNKQNTPKVNDDWDYRKELYGE